MIRVRYSKRARGDLIDVWTRIAVQDEPTANRVLDSIADRCAHLADFPELGRLRPEIGPEVRSLVVERWLVLYRVSSTFVHIVRVVDGGRDLQNPEILSKG